MNIGLAPSASATSATVSSQLIGLIGKIRRYCPSKRPALTTVCWISDSCPMLARLFGGGLRAAEAKLRRKLEQFYISKIVWVPKQNGCYVHFGNTKDCQQAARHWNRTSRASRAFIVEGQPFVEDLTSRKASPLLEVKSRPKFALTQEDLFVQMRRFGKMRDMTVDESKGVACVRFSKVSYANAARNCMDGKEIGESILEVNYIRLPWKLPVDLLTSPKAIVPIAAATFVLFTALLSPVRIYFVAQRLTVEQSIDTLRAEFQNNYAVSKTTSPELELREWINGRPSNVLMLVGPKGTDKSMILNKVLQRRIFSVRVDCSQVETVQDFVDHFVRDIGFRPSFAAFNHLFFVLFSSFIPNATQLSHDIQIQSLLSTLDRVFALPHSTSQHAVIAFDEFDQFVKILHSEKKEEAKRAATVLNILCNWAKTTTVRGRAHIIFVSNTVYTRDKLSLIEGFNSLPTIWFNDISHAEAEEYLRSRIISMRGINSPILSRIPDIVRLLGGRLGDLDHLLFQLSCDRPVDKAVFQMLEDTKMRLRNTGFGPTIFSSSQSPWNQIQLWKLMMLLQKSPYVDYDYALVTIFEGNESAIEGLVENRILSIHVNANDERLVVPYSPLMSAAFTDLIDRELEFRWGMERYKTVFEIGKDMSLLEKLETELTKLSTFFSCKGVYPPGEGIENRFLQLDKEIQAVYQRLAAKKRALSTIEHAISQFSPCQKSPSN
ncbi:mitochondrial escape protein 2 homolog [Schistocerca gregaria]|uniref:mitochondrial escape protein 2 homolog n=1 Tax=Schistocerca gregaria TaxID=7010 RepID=UPI00211E0F3C|nr:mitochondrial escape protein 2 homolog [Schistocerca gregaria]